MRILKAIINFYINSSIHVALAVYALAYISLLQFDLPEDYILLNFIFLASITGYNFVKYFGLAKFHHRSLTDALRIIQIFSALVFLGMFYFFAQLSIKIQLIISVLGIITFLYAIPVASKKYFIDEQKNLREISGLKIYIIALVWSFVTVILPLQNSGYTINGDVIVTLVQRFLYIMVLMLPFEIRDLNYDHLRLATIPQQIGVKKTKGLGVILLIVFFLLEFFKDETSSSQLLLHLIISVITVVALLYTKKKQSRLYTSFWVESLPILWLVLFFVFGEFFFEAF